MTHAGRDARHARVGRVTRPSSRRSAASAACSCSARGRSAASCASGRAAGTSATAWPAGRARPDGRRGRQPLPRHLRQHRPGEVRATLAARAGADGARRRVRIDRARRAATRRLMPLEFFYRTPKDDAARDTCWSRTSRDAHPACRRRRRTSAIVRSAARRRARISARRGRRFASHARFGIVTEAEDRAGSRRTDALGLPRPLERSSAGRSRPKRRKPPAKPPSTRRRRCRRMGTRCSWPRSR